MTTSRAVYHGPDIVELHTPYDPNFVDQLKVEIPAGYRQWQPDRKTWIVEEPFDTIAVRILLRFFPTAEIDAKPGRRPLFTEEHACRCDSNHRTLFVCQGAPEPVIKAAYRALVRINHPDAGGDTQAMQRINDAYSQLAQEAR